MLINFESIKEVTIPHLNQGDGTVSAKMFVNENGKVMPSRIAVASSIGLHRHETSDEIDYILAGNGEIICDGVKEEVKPGMCHICFKGSSHSIVNTGNCDLEIFTVVVER